MQTTNVEGIECAVCGFTSVPYQCFGCECCGAYGTDLKREEFSGRGTVLSRTTVWHSPRNGIDVPYEVGNIRLVEGPVLRARIVGGGDEVGRAVEAVSYDGELAFREVEDA